jgi:hypothetical protein
MLGFVVANILTTVLTGEGEPFGPTGSSVVLLFHLVLILAGSVALHRSPARYYWLAHRNRESSEWSIRQSVFLAMAGGLAVGLFLGRGLPAVLPFRLSPAFRVLDGLLLPLIGFFAAALLTDTELATTPVEQGYISPSGAVFEELEQTVENIENKLPPNESGRALILQRRANGYELLPREAVIRRSLGKVFIIDFTPIFDEFNRAHPKVEVEDFEVTCTFLSSATDPVGTEVFEPAAIDTFLKTKLLDLPSGSPAVTFVRDLLREALRKIGRQYADQLNALNQFLLIAAATPEKFLGNPSAPFEPYESPYRRPNSFNIPFTRLYEKDVAKEASRRAEAIWNDHTAKFRSADTLIGRKELDAAFQQEFANRMCQERMPVSIRQSMERLLAHIQIETQIEVANYSAGSTIRELRQGTAARWHEQTTAAAHTFEEVEREATNRFNQLVDQLANDRILMEFVRPDELKMALFRLGLLPDLLGKVAAFGSVIRDYPKLAELVLPTKSLRSGDGSDS